MKVIFCIIIFMPFVLFAQSKKKPSTSKSKTTPAKIAVNDKTPRINGIGLFKLGGNKKDILDSIQKVTGYQLEVSNSKLTFLNKKFIGLCRCIKCEGNAECHSSEHYLLSSINIQGIELKQIEFGFYNDSLYDFNCDATRDFIDAVKAKYGDGVLEEESKTIYCQNQYNGAQIEHEESTFTTKWRDDKQVECWNTLRHYYDDKCESVYYDMFYLVNLVLDKRQHDCLMAEYDKMKEQKKNNLDKF